MGFGPSQVLFPLTGRLPSPATSTHLPLVMCHPQFIFVEGPTVLSCYCPSRRHDGQSWTIAHPASGCYPIQRSAPRWNQDHRRSFLPWALPLAGFSDALGRMSRWVWILNRNHQSPGNRFRFPIRSWVFTKPHKINRRPDLAQWVHPVCRQPFSVLMRLTPIRSTKPRWLMDRRPVWGSAPSVKVKLPFISLFASVLTHAWRSHSSQWGA